MIEFFVSIESRKAKKKNLFSSEKKVTNEKVINRKYFYFLCYPLKIIYWSEIALSFIISIFFRVTNGHFDYYLY